eukprot:TRINITY_DN20505_c0_g2_i1.p1 TRINITY_DN20505_c0_g2~~TRINITY_DN20505_c0_g2_i1.p1  ORF type:complete len:197 (-),score=17.40 TRINITY_DN20505_c0_g2_i1:67-657(-)
MLRSLVGSEMCIRDSSHICDLCTRGFGTLTGHDGEQVSLQDHHRVTHSVYHSLKEHLDRRREALLVAHGEPRAGSIQGLTTLRETVRTLERELAVMTDKYERSVGASADLEDCYHRMVQVPGAVLVLDQLGVETAQDLKELDLEDVHLLVAPLRKALTNKLLRVLEIPKDGQKTRSGLMFRFDDCPPGTFIKLHSR